MTKRVYSIKLTLNSLRNNAAFFRMFDKSKTAKHKLDRKSVNMVIRESYNSNRFSGMREMLRDRLHTALEERKEFRNTSILEDIELNTFEKRQVEKNIKNQQKTALDSNDVSIDHIMPPVNIIEVEDIPQIGNPPDQLN